MTDTFDKGALAVLRERHQRPNARFARLSHGEVHWLDEGEDTGLPAIVLLPGQWLGATAFDRLAGELARRTRVLRLDLPGHGLAAPFDNGDYSAMGYARATRELLEHEAPSRFVLVGQSHSGIPAALLAQEGLLGLAGLVLATASGMPRDRSAPTGGQNAAKAAEGTEDWFRARLKGLLKRPHANDAFDALVRETWAYNRLPGRKAESARRLSQFDPSLFPRLLPQVTLPTLVLWSSASTYLPPSMAEALAALLPRCHDCRVVPQSGHLLLADAPQDAAGHILDFLETLA
jgi:pimeloyl-ACP methyl ester carboxylesterase